MDVLSLPNPDSDRAFPANYRGHRDDSEDGRDPRSNRKGRRRDPPSDRQDRRCDPARSGWVRGAIPPEPPGSQVRPPQEEKGGERAEGPWLWGSLAKTADLQAGMPVPVTGSGITAGPEVARPGEDWRRRQSRWSWDGPGTELPAACTASTLWAVRSRSMSGTATLAHTISRARMEPTKGPLTILRSGVTFRVRRPRRVEENGGPSEHCHARRFPTRGPGPRT